jgi:putative oxidoreductase
VRGRGQGPKRWDLDVGQRGTVAVSRDFSHGVSMDDLFLVGRMIFGGFFLYNGANHFLSHAMFVQYTAAKGVPMSDIAVPIAGLLILVGGLCVIAGLWPYLGASCIALFLIGVTPIMHNLWDMADETQRTIELANFAKNLALLGATVMMVGVPRPWPYSLEQQKRIAA